MKKEGKKWMLVALALLAVVTVALPLVGCKNDTVAEQTGDGTGSGSGNQGSGDPEQPVTYTVSFKTNEGSTVPSQTVESGKTATKPADPTLENNVFGGWYSDKELTSEYDFTTPVTGSFTLYAKWVKRIEVTASSVSSVIAGLTGDGSYILVAIGNWSSDDLSAITTALNEKPTAKVNLDLSKATDLTTIGNDAFRGCSGLTSISIPSSVEIIGDFAFRGCSGLTSISIPSSVTTIGDFAFDGCSELTTVTFGEESQLETIGEYAFRECSSLTSISIPSSVTSIGNYAFYGCDSLTSITIPSSVTSIGNYAFGGCDSLTSISIPSSVTSIGGDAFRDCSSLTSISIPEGVKSIGGGAFRGCSGLTSISIPSSVTSIGNYAFRRCSGATVKVEAENPPTLGSDVFGDVSKILVPSGFVDTYKEKWSDYEGKIEPIPE